MTAQNDTDYAAVKLQPYRLLTLRTEFEAAAASAPAGIFPSMACAYTRAERNGLLYYIQRGVKFPCDALFRDGRLIAWLCLPGTGQSSGARRLEGIYAAGVVEGLCRPSALRCFHAGYVPCLCATAWSSPRTFICLRGAPRPFPHCLSGHPTTKMTAHRPISVMRRGYAVVVQDVRGRNESGGEWLPHYYEVEDGDDTPTRVERRNGADGSVGMLVVHTSDMHSGARRSGQPVSEGDDQCRNGRYCFCRWSAARRLLFQRRLCPEFRHDKAPLRA